MSEEAPDYPEEQPPDPSATDGSPPGEPADEEFPTEPPIELEAPVTPTVLAEPGVYVCTQAPEGSHAVLGVLTEGQEYDFTKVDSRTLQSVAAYVEAGYLELKA